MGEFFRSLMDWLKERATSPFWGVYFFAFVFWNWRIIYTLFWQDSSPLHQPAIEYIEKQVFFFQSANSQGKFLALLGNEFLAVAIPILITGVLIKVMPIVHAWACRIKEHSHFQLLAIKDGEQEMYEKGRIGHFTKVAESKDKQIKVQKSIQKKEKELQETEKEHWETEYSEFEKHPLFSKFQQILTSVHESQGYIDDDNVDIKAVAHAKNLIIFTKDKETGLLGKRIELTDKGRFFGDKYLEKHPLVPKIRDLNNF